LYSVVNTLMMSDLELSAISMSESESESDLGSSYAPSEGDEWYSEALRVRAYSDLDYEDDATESLASLSSRDLTDGDNDDGEDESGEAPTAGEISNWLSDLAANQTSSSKGSGAASATRQSNPSKRPRAATTATTAAPSNPPKRPRATKDTTSQEPKMQCRSPSPASALFSKVVDAMEGNRQKIGKGPWVDRLLHPCAISLDQWFSCH
jgi:hypothetical protein